MGQCEWGAWILGCAQLGMAYGVANDVGDLGRDGGRPLILAAREVGVVTFDTAQAYGASEARLGHALAGDDSPDLRIVTKLSPMLDPGDSGMIRDAVEKSIHALGRVPWGILLHDPSWMDVWDGGLGAVLRDVRGSGFCTHLGVSVYTPEEAFRALRHPDLTLVQVPANAWGDGFTDLGFWALAAESGTTVFVRSIYLQGLLRLEPAAVADFLPEAREASCCWARLADDMGCTPGALALRYARGFGVPLVIGCETPAQVRENAHAFETEPPLDPDASARIRACMKPHLRPDMIDPRRWPRRNG